MARLKRYELYEGNGETLPDEYAGPRPEPRETPLPGKPALGRAETLRERDQMNRAGEALAQRKHYFASNDTGDDAEPVSPLFDDFDRFNPRPEPPAVRKKRKDQGRWTAVTVVCLVILLGLGALMLPQLTGLRYRFLPNLAFANGTIIRLDAEQEEILSGLRKEMYSDRIYQGIYIDNVHVGGMTKAEAVRAVEAVNEKTDVTFDLTVTIGNESWHVNSERVPVSRNIEELVEKAWAQGRSNTDGLRGSGMTPLQERINQASAMRSGPISYTSEQDYDRDALRTMVEGIANYVDREPVNSTVESFDFGSKTFSFTEDRPGARVDPDDLYERLATLLDNGVTQTTVNIVPEKVLAEVTRAELMNRFGLVSAYTTSTTSNKNRNTNIDLSAKAINGRTVMPGEIFSFNGATGERTAEKGYREAAAISGGQSRDEIGGGVCQTSSTLFNAVARANLEIIERNPHAWPSNYVEKGFDATVNWPGLDFKFRNNTEWPVFIIAAYAKQKVTVNIYGMSLGADERIDLESQTVRTIPQPEGVKYVLNPELAPGESKKTVSGRKGYEVETWKVWYQGNRETKRELLFKTTYKAYQETVEYNQ